jgi:hypothetical protein
MEANLFCGGGESLGTKALRQGFDGAGEAISISGPWYSSTQPRNAHAPAGELAHIEACLSRNSFMYLGCDRDREVIR